MKRIIVIAAFITLAGCSSNKPPESILVTEKEVQPMSRNEVINAVQECQSANLRAILIYAKRRINNQNSDVVIDVTCGNKFSF